MLPWAILAIFLLMFGGLFIFLPSFAIWTYHRRKMEELQLQRNATAERQLQAQLDALRAEIQSLRDTTLQYDLSFDTALQRLEARVAQLERQRAHTSVDEATQRIGLP
ncbi:MAG: hypothetical protein RMJ43_12835 [Chloroherpetonaceae bacterium]|nr:hypothetical protein [Chthonomonadaceae bacterium]MDW8208715.1 hypothetical protein [Chloroherpetonaceae bacterium]